MVCSRSPAPMASTNVAATSAITRPSRSTAAPCRVMPRDASCFIASAGSTFAALNAGSIDDTRAVNTARPSVNASTQPLR